jgi:hypothetical protein
MIAKGFGPESVPKVFVIMGGVTGGTPGTRPGMLPLAYFMIMACDEDWCWILSVARPTSLHRAGTESHR